MPYCKLLAVIILPQFVNNADNLKINIMRKLILFFALIVICFSCEDDNDTSMKSSSGIIRELQGSFYMYGTHTLESNTGETLYALSSSSINLYEFNDMNVEVKGNLIDGYPVDGGPEYLEVKTVKLNE